MAVAHSASKKAMIPPGLRLNIVMIAAMTINAPNSSEKNPVKKIAPSEVKTMLKPLPPRADPLVISKSPEALALMPATLDALIHARNVEPMAMPPATSVNMPSRTEPPGRAIS
jgi:hypothetical protein